MTFLQQEPEIRRNRSKSDGAPTILPIDERFEVFPSLPDSVLDKMGLLGDGSMYVPRILRSVEISTNCQTNRVEKCTGSVRNFSCSISSLTVFPGVTPTRMTSSTSSCPFPWRSPPTRPPSRTGANARAATATKPK